MTSQNWATVASLATAFGTLVLAVATFSAVRSANRAARATERSVLAGLSPILVTSRREDPPQRIGFVDDRFLTVEGSKAAAECSEHEIYLVISLRNVGSGVAVLDRWHLTPERAVGADATHADPSTFRRLTRDIYVPPGDVGFWQGALRDPSEALWQETRDAIEERRAFTIDLLYTDHDGGQRTITRFALLPGDEGRWLAAVTRHWYLDRPSPR